MKEIDPILRLKTILAKPDATVPAEEMQEYGYTWDGMRPIGKETAIGLFYENFPIYCLHQDGTETAAWRIGDIMQHADRGGYFGIDKEDLEQCLSLSTQEGYAPTLAKEARQNNTAQDSEMDFEP